MRTCRICNAHCPTPDYSDRPPSILSTGGTADVGLDVFFCRTCGHAQSSELPDLHAFYDTEYQISLGSNEHDQLYESVNGQDLFRTDKQRDMVLSALDLVPGMNILDYGAAKASTLKKICEAKPSLVPHVFDVSSDYEAYWTDWIEPDAQASYVLPDRWRGHFDAVTAHFVLEHVADPLSMLRELRSLLKRNGQLFLTVPNVLANPGDLLVADHINHFTEASLHAAFSTAGLRIETVAVNEFRGAFVVVARAGDQQEAEHCADVTDELKKLARFWRDATAHVRSAAEKYAGRKAAIYGAGFYGSFIANCLGQNDGLVCFVDRNRHLHGQSHFGQPICGPEELPAEVSVVYAGLNPKQARLILENVPEWHKRDLDFVYLAAE